MSLLSFKKPIYGGGGGGGEHSYVINYKEQKRKV